MKKTLRFLAVSICILMVMGGITAFMLSDPKPNVHLHNLDEFDKIDLKDIHSDYGRKGVFKSSALVRESGIPVEEKVFFGQEIGISGNEQLDKIRIGVTSNLISRMEIWKGGRLVQAKEMGFVGKTTRGDLHELTVEFQDQTNAKQPGTAKIMMRYFSGSGFFGDTGVLAMDLTSFGDLSGEKSVSLFAASPENDQVRQVEFKNLKIWKDFQSFD
jgi:hypothetical protein